MSEQKPSIGRIVHYQAHGSPDGTHKSEPRPAIITRVSNDTNVDLAVFNPTGMFFNQGCLFDGGELPKGGTWRWPPRVALFLLAALGLALAPLEALAQTVDPLPAPSIGSTLLGFLSPEGVGGVIALILTAIGGFQFFTAKRKKLVAMASYYAFHIVEDIGNEIEGEDGFDKTAKYLQKVDAYMVAQGYRPLKPGEVEVAKLLASAAHGQEVAKAKVLVAAAEQSRPS